jgi:hypothetical protein
MLTGNLINDLKCLFEARQDKLYAEDICGLSGKYKELERDADTKCIFIRNELPEELVDQFIAFTKTRIAMEVASNSMFYKQGFSDCIKTLLYVLMKR